MTDTAVTNIQLSDNAARRIAFLASSQPKPGAMLRISVEGGGCSGFQYKYEFVWNQESDDTVLEKHGAKVLVDSTSQELMSGTLIDFEETLGAAAFAIKNPNATAKCGCGNSFSV
jgi:iron-sulfur cluster assembly accessory protein